MWVVCGDGGRKWRGCGVGEDVGRWVVCGCVGGMGRGVQLSGGGCAALTKLWAQASPSVQQNQE